MINRAQFNYFGTNDNAVFSLSVNLSSPCVAGNLIVAVGRYYNTTVSSVTDTRGTVYSHVVTTGDDPTLSMWAGVLTTGGTNSVTFSWPTSTAYRWVFAVEYSGGWSSFLDTAVSGSGLSVAGGDITCSPLSTLQSEKVLVMLASQNSSATYTPGPNFTLIHGSILGETTHGGAQEYITGQSLSNYVPHIQSTITNKFATVCGSFKTTASSVPSIPSTSGLGSYDLLYQIAQNTAGVSPSPSDGTYTLASKALSNMGGTPMIGDSIYNLFYKIAGTTAGVTPKHGDSMYNLLSKITQNTSKGASGDPSINDTPYTLLSKIAGNTKK